MCGAGLSRRYGSFVEPRRSGRRLDVHMEPFSTLAQRLAPYAPGRGGSGKAGSRPSRRGLEACLEPACVAGMGLLWGLGAMEGD